MTDLPFDGVRERMQKLQDLTGGALRVSDSGKAGEFEVFSGGHTSWPVEIPLGVLRALTDSLEAVFTPEEFYKLRSFVRTVLLWCRDTAEYDDLSSHDKDSLESLIVSGEIITAVLESKSKRYERNSK